jgi:hypothetical protein
MMMQLSRDHVHVAKNGLSIQFKAGVSTYVPPRMVPDIVGLGGSVAETDQAVVDAEMKVVDEAKIATEGRAPAIEAAIRTMIARNQRGDFTAGGKPNLNVLLKMTGLIVTADELEAPWRKVRAEIQ